MKSSDALCRPENIVDVNMHGTFDFVNVTIKLLLLVTYEFLLLLSFG